MKSVRFSSVIACVLLLAASASAQLRLSLTISPRPSPYISDWASKRETAILTITNTQGSSVDAKLRAKVSADGSVRAETKTPSMPIITVSPGVSTYYADQLLPQDAITFYGGVEKTAMHTGMLPAGVYELCVDLVDPAGERPLSQPACRNFQLTSYQLPVLQLPENQKVLAAGDKPTFRWTPVIPAPSGGVRYELKVFELIPGQTATGVLRNGIPIFDREILGQTQMLWPPDFVLPEGDKQFAWSVQSLDADGKPIGDQDGWAEPFTFSTKSAGGGAGTGGGETKNQVILAGVVRDFYTNEPIPNARVTYHSAALTLVRGLKYRIPILSESKDSMVTTADGSGNFSFTGVRDSSYFSLRASAAGYLYTIEKSYAQKQQGNISDYVLLMKPNRGTIKGRVVDSLTNKGINNITVELWRKRKPIIRNTHVGIGGLSRTGSKALMPGDELVATASTGAASAGAGSSGGIEGGGKGAMQSVRFHAGASKMMSFAFSLSGAFEFDSVEGGSDYYIVVNDSRFLKVRTPNFSVEAQKTHDAGTILLQPKVGTIEGWVKEEGTNKPLSGAQVYILSDVGPSISMSSRLGVGSAGGWSASMGNAGQSGNFTGFQEAANNNQTFIPKTGTSNIDMAGGAFSTGGGSGGGAGKGKATPNYEWSKMSAWTPALIAFGQQPPPTMPDTTPLYGPVVTDENGHFVFQNVRINDPLQISDRYAVWAKTPGYYDSYKNVRLTQHGQTKQVTLTTSIAKGIIYGKITSALDNSPIGGVKVELLKTGGGFSGLKRAFKIGGGGGGGGSTTASATAYSNPDGTYTLFNIDSGSYANVKFTKTGVSDYIANGPIEVTNGTVMELNASMDVATGTIRGVVTSNTGDSLAGVIVHTAGGQTATTFFDGTYILPNVPIGTQTVIFSQPGFYDSTKTAKINNKGDTVTVNMKMFAYTGTIAIVVQDSTTNLPMQNASVTLAGTKQTDVGGQAVFNDILIGQKKLTVVADTSGGKDYKSFTTNVMVNEGANAAVVVKLVPGGRISGTVENSGTLAGIDSVNISIDGVAGVTARTGPDGKFVLRNVPAGIPLIVKASKAGFKNGKSPSITLAQGESRTDIVITLESVPLQTLYGFKVEVDTIEEKFGKKYVTGSLYGIPDNPVVKLQDSNFKFPIEEVEVDDNYKAVPASYEFAIDELPIKLFGMKAKLIDSTAFLRVKYIDSVNAGMIYGNKITLDKVIPTWIPGSKWAAEKITWAANLLPPGVYSDGVFHANASALGINVDGSSVGIELFGFKLTLDYSKSKFSSEGIEYYGSMKIPGIPNTIGIEDLHIKLKDEATGAVKFVGVTVKTTPPIVLNVGLFKLTDSSATWNEQGFKTSGMIELTALGNKKFGFKDLWIGPNGDFLGITINPDPSNNKITVLGQELTITSLGFGTTTEQTPRKFFQFSGKLKISVIDKPIEFQDLKYYQDGEFTGTIAFNQSVKIFSVITLQLQSVEFNKDTHGKFIFIKGGIKFEIPMLSVQVGNFRFYENGTVNVEQIGIGFTAGPVQVAASLSWTNNVFEGTATLVIQPVFNVSASFRYASGNDWWIKIKAGIPPVPIWPNTNLVIAGELGYNNGYWTFGFGGTVSVGNAQDAIKLDLYVKVTTSAGGPVIQGTAQVIVMTNVQIGEATITLDFPNKLFTGNINFGWNKKGITVQAWIDIAVKANDYWFVGAGVKVGLFSLINLDVALYIAKNYSGYMHTLPVTYHPDNTTINGFHLDGTLLAGWGESGDSWSLGLKLWAYVSIDWNQGLAGGFKCHAYGSFDLWVIGGSGDVDLEAAVQYVNSRLKFHGYASLNIKLWLWPCDSGDSCWHYCFPSGGTACFDVSITADYDSSSGWDWSVNW